MKKISIVVIVLSILLVVAVGFIGYNFYTSARYSQQIGIYNQGMSAGAGEVISQLLEIAVTCQTVPLTTSDNQTINLIAVECLQQPAA